MKFGKCLGDLLISRGWSSARLSRELNIDASYVRRWVRGDRVPALKTNYVDEIARCLSVGLEDTNKSFLKNIIIKDLNEKGFNFKEKENLNEIIKTSLTIGQIYTLKLSPEDRKIMDESKENEVLNFLEYINDDKEDKNYLKNGDYAGRFTNGKIPHIIQGREDVINASLSFIKNAVYNKHVSKKEIFMTFQSEKDYFHLDTPAKGALEKEIKNALLNGWNVEHLCRLNKDVTRSFSLVQKIIMWIGYKGKYQPYYFNKYGTTYPPSEMIIIPDVGALVCFASQNIDYVDTAFFYTERAAVEALTKYFKQLFLYTDPLFKVFGVDEYFYITTEKDKKHGDRNVFTYELDGITIPHSLWLKYLDRTFTNKEEIIPHAERIKIRQESFYEQVERYKFRNICLIKSIEYMVETGNYYYDTKYRKPHNGDILEHLENIVYLLKTYKNFELGLIDDSLAQTIPMSSWEVKGDHTVIIDIWNRYIQNQAGEDEGLFLSITEGTIAGSFKDYFSELWDRITPKYRDKKYVIGWLEEQINVYKDNFMK